MPLSILVNGLPAQTRENRSRSDWFFRPMGLADRFVEELPKPNGYDVVRDLRQRRGTSRKLDKTIRNVMISLQ